jgi:hypothetical protein
MPSALEVLCSEYQHCFRAVMCVCLILLVLNMFGKLGVQRSGVSPGQGPRALLTQPGQGATSGYEAPSFWTTDPELRQYYRGSPDSPDYLIQAEGDNMSVNFTGSDYFTKKLGKVNADVDATHQGDNDFVEGMKGR